MEVYGRSSNIKKTIEFIQASPTAHFACLTALEELQNAGYTLLKEEDPWDLAPGGRYCVCRGGTTLAAWVQPTGDVQRIAAVASHSDSPALKLKPHAEYTLEGHTMLGVEVYGSPLLNSWLNRDLGIAGKVCYEDIEGTYRCDLVCIDDAPVVIPQLAIHLDRDVGKEGLKLNKQQHLSALAGTKPFLLPQLQRKFPLKTLLAHELYLYPLESPSESSELLTGYRIDNLLSLYCSLKALLPQEAAETDLKILFCWDHEEVGSASNCGASSPFALHLLERICGREKLLRLLPQGTCLSCDSAHALHPNYLERHEPAHRPLLGGGPVIKWNSQQRYATTAELAGKLSLLAKEIGIPLQQFVVRSDMPCGSTIGPLHATATGMPTVDLGIPQLSMHAAREVAHLDDIQSLTELLKSSLRAIF